MANVLYNTTGGGESEHNTELDAFNRSNNSVRKEPDEYLYAVFKFERVIYLYIWETLVLLTFLVNILVILVLLQKKMRSAANLIFVAIAISDSLTGLVTLPSYIMVYQTDYPATVNKADYPLVVNNTDYPECYSYDEGKETNSTNYMYTYTHKEEFDVYYILLSKSLFNGFMLSKYFLTRSFHSVSIWLTIFLGIQRYISVAYPFKTQTWFTIRNTVIHCVATVVLAPILHLYHVLYEKASDGFHCSWELQNGNAGDVSHLLVTLFFRHLIPCCLLTITTILFVYHLNNKPIKRQSTTSTRVISGNEVRADEYRRVSKIVIAIVIVFLLPEVPYALFLLFTTYVRLTNANHLPDQKTNRAFHAGYDIALVVSFQLNFYIYTFFNKRFRQHLKRMCISFGTKARSFSILSTANRTMDGDTRNVRLPNTDGSKGVPMKSLSD